MKCINAKQFNDFVNNSVRIDTLEPGQKFCDMSGRIMMVAMKEDNITWASNDCYANCALVIPLS